MYAKALSASAYREVVSRCTSKNAVPANFVERRTPEVQLPRTPLLGTSVNKGKKEGRGHSTTALQVPPMQMGSAICAGGVTRGLDHAERCTQGFTFCLRVKRAAVYRLALAAYPRPPTIAPYVGDSIKLIESGFRERKAIVIFGYEHSPPLIDISVAIDSFEAIAKQVVGIELGERQSARFGPLIHPVHQQGKVFGWQVFGFSARWQPEA
jgi:hypothetical protein